MKFSHTTYPQRPLDFDAFRNKGLGSSDAPIIMNASPWMNRRQLFEIKTGLTLPEPANYQMRAGVRLEPVARKAYEAETGFEMPTARLWHEKFSFIRANFDGINHDAKRVLEIKYAGRDDHYRARHGKVPVKYYWQLVHLLLVSGYEELDYYSYNPAHGGGVIVRFKRDTQAESRLIKELSVFWECVKNNTPPSSLLFVDSGLIKQGQQKPSCLKDSFFKIKRSKR